MLEVAIVPRGRAQSGATAIAPFVILHDRTLVAIAALSPQSMAELDSVPGIGPAKLTE